MSGDRRWKWHACCGSRPAVGELALLVGRSCLPADTLDALDDVQRPPDASGVAHALVAALPGAIAFRANWQRRWMRRAATPMSQRMGGRVVYHEANLIARPFDGVTVVTVHDLSWRANPSWHPAERVAWIERRLPGTLAQASRFVSVSDFTAREMTRWLGIDRSRIDVVRHGVSAIFRPMTQDLAAAALRRFDVADRGYILAVSTLEPRKNFDRLLAAHTMLPMALRQRFPLVIAGGRGWGGILTSGRRRPGAPQRSPAADRPCHRRRSRCAVCAMRGVRLSQPLRGFRAAGA